MRKVSAITTGVIGGALLCGALAWLVPNPVKTDGLHFHVFLSAALAMAMLFIGASALFATGLAGFTPKLKRAYRLVCIGVGLFGLAQLQLPLTVLENNQASWHRLDFMPVVFFAAILTLFLGIRAFAKLFGIKGMSMTWWAPLLVFIILASIAVALPHPPSPNSEFQFDGANVFTLYIASFVLFGEWQLIQVKRAAGAAYTNALAWLIIGFGVIYAAGIATVVVSLAVGSGPWYIDIFDVLVPFTIAALLFIRAAYSFNFISTTEHVETLGTSQSFFGNARSTARSANESVSSIDIVVLAASLVSNPREIDPILDGLRALTSKLPVGARPSAAQDVELQRLYMQIEDYLVHKEQVRSFTRVDIRQRIGSQLQLGADSATFWTALPEVKDSSAHA
ncbi:MAG TPA: hypothetical protein VLF60_02290 [Candidatus Saccharimonadales bacterium]|nr:hypothetical protein [Candidatus Saccharimonadales bacterium]